MTDDAQFSNVAKKHFVFGEYFSRELTLTTFDTFVLKVQQHVKSTTSIVGGGGGGYISGTGIKGAGAIRGHIDPISISSSTSHNITNQYWIKGFDGKELVYEFNNSEFSAREGHKVRLTYLHLDDGSSQSFLFSVSCDETSQVVVISQEEFAKKISSLRVPGVPTEWGCGTHIVNLGLAVVGGRLAYEAYMAVREQLGIAPHYSWIWEIIAFFAGLFVTGIGVHLLAMAIFPGYRRTKEQIDSELRDKRIYDKYLSNFGSITNEAYSWCKSLI
jgi:hypothetical protein